MPFHGFVRRTVPLLALTMLLTIGAASDEGEPIYGLNDEELFWTGNVDAGEPPDLCMMHEFSVPGQGLHVSGSSMTGALVMDPTTDLYAGARPVVPAIPEATRTHFQDRVDTADRSVVILVVDDFRELAEAEVGPQSHGDLVMHHLETLVDDVLGEGVKSSDEYSIRWTIEDDVQLIVVAFDLAQESPGNSGDALETIKTSTIASDLEAAFYEVMDREEQIGRVVINMSWVLLPCATIEEFDPEHFKDFEVYVEALSRVDGNRPSTKEDLFRAMTTPWNNDPLLKKLNQLDGGYVAPVAAAGNFGLPFQMLPANWERVIGVSATPGPPAYSNEKGVIANGGWYTYDPARNRHGPAYAGTSFAAPLVALFTALDLMNESPLCTDLLNPLPGLEGPGTLKRAIEACRPASATR